jgi:hypothetical protein
MRTTKQADYMSWKAEGAADLANRHDVKPGIIPERLWRNFYIRGALTAEGCGSGGRQCLQRDVACRLVEAAVSDDLPFKVVRSNSHDELLVQLCTSRSIGEAIHKHIIRLLPFGN